jgi:predicted Zn-dependent peptidase
MTVLSRHLPRALQLLGDMVARPRFDAAEWQRSQQRRLAEIARRRDEPRYIASTVFASVLYGEHPYAHPALGTPASLAALSVEDLRSFYATHYGPRTVTFVLVGDTTQAQALKLVGSALSGWSANSKPAPAPRPLAANNPRFVVVDRPGAPQSEVLVGHLGRERKTTEYAALSLLEVLLGGSFTSRLNQNLREKHGYTYGAFSRFDLWRAPGPFAAAAAVRTEVTAESLTEMITELKAIRAPLSAEELAKGRSLVRADLVEAFADGRRTTLEIADLVLHDLPLDTWSKVGVALDKLAADGVTRSATRLFLPDQLLIVVVGDRQVIDKPLAALPFAKSIEYRDLDGKLLK